MVTLFKQTFQNLRSCHSYFWCKSIFPNHIFTLIPILLTPDITLNYWVFSGENDVCFTWTLSCEMCLSHFLFKALSFCEKPAKALRSCFLSRGVPSSACKHVLTSFEKDWVEKKKIQQQQKTKKASMCWPPLRKIG